MSFPKRKSAEALGAETQSLQVGKVLNRGYIYCQALFKGCYGFFSHDYDLACLLKGGAHDLSTTFSQFERALASTVSRNDTASFRTVDKHSQGGS